MTKRILILFAIFLTVTFFKCEEKNSIVGPLPSGTYSLSSFDEQGNKLVEGEFSVVFNDSKSFKGEWEFKAVGTIDNPRPQVGAGELVGEIDNEEVHIDLNPGWRDNNAYLTGKFNNGTLSGEWQWIGFAGIPEKGTFTAKEK